MNMGSTNNTATINIKSLSLTELKALGGRIDTAIERHEKKQRTQALNELKKKAKSLGFGLDELVGAPTKRPAAKPAKKKAPLPPVYRDPSNATNAWSGRGRRPDWVLKALEEGKSLDDLKI